MMVRNQIVMLARWFLTWWIVRPRFVMSSAVPTDPFDFPIEIDTERREAPDQIITPVQFGGYGRRVKVDWPSDTNTFLESLQHLIKVLDNLMKMELYTEYDGVTEIWRFDDLCQRPRLSAYKSPNFLFQLVNSMFHRMLPCVIQSPLNCYWDGSRLQSERRWLFMDSSTASRYFNEDTTFPIGNFTWRNLDLDRFIRSTQYRGEFQNIDNVREGLGSGFLTKACVPTDNNDTSDCESAKISSDRCFTVEKDAAKDPIEQLEYTYISPEQFLQNYENGLLDSESSLKSFCRTRLPVTQPLNQPFTEELVFQYCRTYPNAASTVPPYNGRTTMDTILYLSAPQELSDRFEEDETRSKRRYLTSPEASRLLNQWSMEAEWTLTSYKPVTPGNYDDIMKNMKKLYANPTFWVGDSLRWQSS